MRLLFITRIIDRDDTRSGFIFDWITALAQRCDRVHLICQQKGSTGGLPGNVLLYSLGKERGYGKIRQLCVFLSHLFGLTKGSDGILVHMHPIYAILAWLPARLHKKKLALWYTHRAADIKLRIAHALVDTVFTASPESFPLPSPKVRAVGHGIELSHFARGRAVARETKVFRMVSVGRISPVKDYETLIKALSEINSQLPTTNYQLRIYGGPALEQDRVYLQKLKSL